MQIHLDTDLGGDPDDACATSATGRAPSPAVPHRRTLIGIGPYTNLALLELVRPGSLSQAPAVVMGGWTQPPSAGLPAWGPEKDWNVQWDTRAAEILAAAAESRCRPDPLT
jgi:inosine-uridine nucleoside N-ribohydrolase